MKKYGLTSSEAEKSRAEFGDNSLTEQKKESFFHKLLSNFGDPMIKILCAALLLNVIFVVLHYAAGIGDTEWYETAGIAAAVIIATVVSTFSEYKNENAFRKLQQEASLIKCKVFRDGEICEISISDIVKGDCILLQSGDKIPADGTITEGSVSVDQSALNGESKEIYKSGSDSSSSDPDLLDGHSVFRGSVVCSGNAVMRADTVGDSSVYGVIARELQDEDDRPSPLKVKLSKLASAISRFGYIGGGAIAVVYMVQSIFFCTGGAAGYFSDPSLWINLFTDIVRAVMFAVIIIVMAVPEGLPLMIAIVSSMNMKKMLRDNVLVRKVTGIETAGSLNILFCDKTGTLTKGELEAVLFLDGEGNQYKSPQEINGGLSDKLALALIHNTDAVITSGEKGVSVIGGNPTERACLGFVADMNDPAPELKHISSSPFDSAKKYSSTTVNNGRTFTLIKGAPEKIAGACTYYYDKNGNKKPLDPEALSRRTDELAKKAIRVLAVAEAEGDTAQSLPEKGLVLIGLLGIRDELRPETAEAVKKVNRAGIQVVMITGDRKETAAAIAEDSGLLKSETDIVLTSDELNSLSDSRVKELLPDIRVIARALPSDKSRLVRLSQEMGLVAGMTGDGVNDSPALKKADVGFAMGGGTEVAKEAGDIVILDDNFSSIAKAVLYGRTIFNNIRKFISFQLAINLSAVLVSFVMPLLGLSNPLSITQILWVNLVMDTLAALALGGEPALERYMLEKPKRRDENIVIRAMKSRLAVSTVWMFALSLFLLTSQIFEQSPVRLFIRHDSEIRNGVPFYPHLMTAYFTFFILIAVFNSLNVRSENLNILEHIGSNKPYFLIMGLIAAIQVIMVYFGGEIFSCYGLSGTEWLVVIAAAVSVIPVDLLRKAIRNRRKM